MKRISIILGSIILVIVGILAIIKQDQEQILVEENTKNENTSLVFMLQEEDGTYSKSDSLPSNGYSFNATKSVCSNGATPTWEDNRLYLNNLTSNGTSCYLYFDQLAYSYILSNSIVNEGIPDFSQVATTDEGMYKAEDDLGTSYYFRGAVENNYLKFAGYYWRIIRINGDGSIRIIYDGTSAHANEERSADRQIGTSAYNNTAGSYNTSVGVGFTFTLNAQRPNGSDEEILSTIKGVLDSWYQTNIEEKDYDNKVVSTPGFCNDRDVASGYNWSVDSSAFYYAAWERLQINKKPMLECNNISDLYTTKVGLITADEVSMAGGVFGTANSSYYLYGCDSYWTMSPLRFTASSTYELALVAYVGFDGSLVNHSVDTVHAVRPVINLSADITLTGTGTMDDPYVVEGAE